MSQASANPIVANFQDPIGGTPSTKPASITNGPESGNFPTQSIPPVIKTPNLQRDADDHERTTSQMTLTMGHSQLLNTTAQRNKYGIIFNSSSANTEKKEISGRNALEKTLHALHVTSQAIPAIQSAIGGILSCLDHFEVARKNREALDDVLSELNEMSTYLNEHLSRPRSQELTKKISDIADSLHMEIKEVQELQEQSMTEQILRAKDHEEELARRFRRIAGLFRRIQLETSMSEWSVMHEATVDALIKDLNPAKLARYNSRLSDAIGRRACTEDTRKGLLNDIDAWCSNPTSPMIYWMNGMAGTGKTTIAYTLAKKLECYGQLGASFFCTITSDECSRASSIVPTIASQLSSRFTTFKAALGEILRECPDAPVLATPEQLERLLIDPLKRVKDIMGHTGNQIVVIDALDECHDGKVVGLILNALINSAGLLPVKFFITSRPDPVIYERLSNQPADLRTALHLHEVGRDEVQQDIKMYLKEGLESIRPSEDNIERLTVLSEQLFIYAATVVRYIIPESASVDSRARLKTMLDINSKSTQKYSGIDTLYTTILSSSIGNNELEPYERDHITAVMWAVVCSGHPLPFTELGVICGLNDELATLAALAPLRSVLHISYTSHTVSAFHASFPQFIFDRSRSKSFFCDPVVAQQKNVLGCLRVINTQLTSSTQLDPGISAYLTFAGEEWTSYLTVVSSGDLEELYSELRRFFEERFEIWTSLFIDSVLRKEVNSERAKIVATARQIYRLTSWFQKIGAPADLCRAAQNAKKYQRWSEADRQLVRNMLTRGDNDEPDAPTETPLYRSWIWEEIDLFAIKYQADDKSYLG